MTVDTQLRETLHRRAEAVEPGENAWPAIASRIQRRQRRTRTATLSLMGGCSLAAVAVAVALVTHAIPDTDQRVAASGGSATAFRPTTTMASSLAVPTAPAPIDPRTGQPVSSEVTDFPASGPTTVPTDPGLVVGGPLAATDKSFEAESIYPETPAELANIQAQVAEGHQPWWIDPSMVASSYLGSRGLTTADEGAPRSVGEAGALRYTTVGGVGGWVIVGQVANGSIAFVAGSRSDRILELRVARQGDGLAVQVMAATAGKVVVRSKRPGADWNRATTEAVAGGKTASLTVDGGAGDLIVQVRHEGDDGRVGLSELRLGAVVLSSEYKALHDGSLLGPSWLGPVRLGMSLAEAARVAGVATTTEPGEYCTGLSPAGRPPGVAFLSTAGKDRVDVITVDAPGVRTDRGIGVGATVAEVRQAYPGIEERLTLDGDGRLVHTPDEPALAAFEMVFGMVDGRVATIWSGSTGLSNTDELCA